MKVRNNYNECLTNLACSIRKYFNLEYKHNTIDYIDKILDENKPKNVVTILCDGMGSTIIDKILTKDSFLLKHKIKSITTVFPATTVAATTSMITGLNPVETAMLGWNMYYKDIDKTIAVFRNCEKGDKKNTPLQEAINYKKEHMITKSIIEEINEKGIDKGYTLSPFEGNPYLDIEDMYNKIEKLCNQEGKKYIYAYDLDPDHSLHELGTDAHEINEIVENINSKVEELSKKLKDTIIFVVADHGHKNIENIMLEDYPDIVDCLERNTSLEPRAVNFFIKKDKKNKFEKLFNDYFKADFALYTKEEVINSNLFGKGKENEIFRDTIGDYLAIAQTDKTLLYGETEIFKSHHAGYTDDEIYVPLIVINTNNL